MFADVTRRQRGQDFVCMRRFVEDRSTSEAQSLRVVIRTRFACGWGLLHMHFRYRLLVTASVGALATASPMAASAGDYGAAALPAVSAPNGKIGVFTGSVGDDFTLGATGSFAIPLTQQWGAQVDGMVGSADSASFYGIGGHVFWRDPARGLLGLTASWVGWDASHALPVSYPSGGVMDITGADVGKVGVEGAAYLGRISLEGAAGYQFGSDTGFAGRATLAFYPTDDLRLDIGVVQLAGADAAFRGGAEWSPAGHAFSLFASGLARSSDNWSVFGGAKVYFGAGQKSLIQRHREDDPENLLPDDLYSVIGEAHCPAGTEQMAGFCDGNL